MLAALLLALTAAAHGAMITVKPVAAEIRLPLTHSGYQKLAAIREPGSKIVIRRDSYFDAFDGKDFRLKRLPSAIKMRLKDRDGELSFQTSEVRSRKRIEAAGLWAEIAVTQAHESKLEGDLGDNLRDLAEKFFEKLSRPGAAVLDAAEKVHARLESERWPGKDRVAEARNSLPRTRLFPAAANVKERMTISLPSLNLAPESLKLGKTEARDEEGKPVTLYELEIDGTADGAEDRARGLLKALKNAGLSAEDLGGPSPDAFLFTARRLRE